MISQRHHEWPATEWRKNVAQGDRFGEKIFVARAAKGRQNRAPYSFAPVGACVFSRTNPWLTPWAILCRPTGAVALA